MSLFGVIFSLVIFNFLLLFFKKIDKEFPPFTRGRKVGIIMAEIGLIVLNVFFAQANYLIVGFVVAYAGFFVWMDVATRQVYDIVNYICLIVLVVLSFVFNKGDYICLAWAAIFVLLGYLKLYGVADGYMFAVFTLFLGIMGFEGFLYPIVLLLLSETISIFFVHIPMYILDKVRKKEVKFWKSRQALSPAILLALVLIIICKGVLRNGVI